VLHFEISPDLVSTPDGRRFRRATALAKRGDSAYLAELEVSDLKEDIARFFEHVKRVLRPQGHFLYTDLRYEDRLAIWQAQIASLGLRIVKQEDITDNVLKAMELDRDRRLQLIRRYIPQILRKPFYHFAGLRPHAPAEALPHLDHRRYWNYVLQKA
jgi:SAM-dependent methyltransferase